MIDILVLFPYSSIPRLLHLSFSLPYFLFCPLTILYEQSLRKETDGKTSLIGFIGAPWTLVAYSVEGGHSKLCPNIKKMCLQDPVFAHSILEKYTEALCTYASYQVRLFFASSELLV